MRPVQLLVPPLLVTLALAACGTPEAASVAAPTPAPVQTVAATASTPVTTGAPLPTTTFPNSAQAAPQTASAAPAHCRAILGQASQLGTATPPEPSDTGKALAECASPIPQGERTPSPLDQATDVAQTAAAQSGVGSSTVITTVAQGPITVLPVPPRQQLTPTPLQGPATIGIQDNQQTVYLAVGDTFQLKLGEQPTWTVQIENEQIVARVRETATDSATQGVYKALTAGQTTLTATGEPACRQSRPACMLPSLLFRLTIVVR
jgi:hypothetical protein